MLRDARVQREASTVARAGHDVTVIATMEPGLPAREERDGFRIVRVEPVPAWVRRLSGRAPIPTQQAEPTAPKTSSDPKGRPLPLVAFRDFLVTRQMTRAAQAIPADLYHAHDLNTLAAGVAAARKHRALLVYDAHELYPDLTGLHPKERARWRRLETRLIGRADAVITPSRARAAEMARRYGIAEPSVVMNCPPAAAASSSAQSPLNALRAPGETLVVYAGGYTVNRGLENIVRAMALLDGCRLALVGYGYLEAALREIAAQIPGDRVTFVPPVPADDVVSTVAVADIGLVSYLPVGLNNELAAPNKLWEYLHAGLAVAASDLPEIRSVVEGYRIGSLFDGNDPASIAAAIEQLASDPVELDAMRARARAAAPHYTWEAQADVLLGIYSKLAPQAGRTSIVE